MRERAGKYAFINDRNFINFVHSLTNDNDRALSQLTVALRNLVNTKELSTVILEFLSPSDVSSSLNDSILELLRGKEQTIQMLTLLCQSNCKIEETADQIICRIDKPKK